MPDDDARSRAEAEQRRRSAILAASGPKLGRDATVPPVEDDEGHEGDSGGAD